MIVKLLLTTIALLGTSMTAVGDFNHVMIIEYDDGGPPGINQAGELQDTMFYMRGPMRREECEAELPATMRWFTEAEAEINSGYKTRRSN